jgi:hypothetical protein
MPQDLFKRRLAGFGGLGAVLLAGLVAGPAMAKTKPPAPVDTSACVDHQLSQPFLSASDSHWYALAPGQTRANFNGNGWTLSRGAQIATARLADGHYGKVLHLPGGSRAVSPVMCVTADYPTARAIVEGADKSGVRFSVSYAGTKTADKAKKTGKIQTHGTGWTLSHPFSTKPGTLDGWQLVRFTFSSKHSDAQLYDFYVDPRMRG